MKITICGSIAFIDEMQEVKDILESHGHEVKTPPMQMIDAKGEAMSVKIYYELRKSAPESDKWIWDKKAEAMKNHFDKVEWADAILVLNKTKNNISHYIGANTLLEMGLAFHRGKDIYLLNSIPEVAYKEEILGMKPIVLEGNLSYFAG